MAQERGQARRRIGFASTGFILAVFLPSTSSVGKETAAHRDFSPLHCPSLSLLLHVAN